jgi:hypothetical protein
MDPKIARDDDNNDDYADDVKDHVLTLAPEDAPTTANSATALILWVLFVIIYIREAVVRPSCPSGGPNRLVQEIGCFVCDQVGLLPAEFLIRLGLPHHAKLLDLTRRMRWPPDRVSTKARRVE